MSELQAAMGLCVLPLVRREIERRQELASSYDRALSGAGLQAIAWRDELHRNFAYYPVLLASESSLLRARDALNSRGIFPRRYFFPALSRLPYVRTDPMPVAEDASRRVLCLPMGYDVAPEDVEEIARHLRSAAVAR
jgi:dTDP-4-amino-4,6-dideoxygalactose transaminase